MDLFRAGFNISKAIKNVSRLREIVSVFARHGFDEFITSGVTSKIPNFVLPKSKRGLKKELSDKKRRDWGEIVGKRLRLCFEELGPAFIKFGQLLSSREDLFDQSFTNEMKILRDKVKTIPFSKVKGEVEKSLGKKIEDLFEYVDDKAIGTASIGVVYRGKLKSGEDVVIKVRRPNIVQEIETDFSIFMFLIGQIEKVSEEIKFLALSRILEDFSMSLENELNFNIEALNCKKLKENLSKHDREKIFFIPEIYNDFSRENILVMDFIDGIPFSDIEKITPYKDEIYEKLGKGITLFIKTFLQDGFFHADLHGGNFFYMPDGKIGLVDFGLMGTLGKKARQHFLAIIYAILTNNHENLVYEFLDVAEYEKIPDVEALTSDVRNTLSKFVGLTVQQTNFSSVLQSIIKNLKDHKIYIPREWYIIFRALITLDGVGKSIGLDFDLLTIIDKDIKEIIADNFKKEDMIEEAVWASRDILAAGRIFPRHFRWFLREWARNGYAFEVSHHGHEKYFNNITSSILFFTFMVTMLVLLSIGVFFIDLSQISSLDKIPMITWIFWSGSAISLIFASRSFSKI